MSALPAFVSRSGDELDSKYRHRASSFHLNLLKSTAARDTSVRYHLLLPSDSSRFALVFIVFGGKCPNLGSGTNTLRTQIWTILQKMEKVHTESSYFKYLCNKKSKVSETLIC